MADYQICRVYQASRLLGIGLSLLLLSCSPPVPTVAFQDNGQPLSSQPPQQLAAQQGQMLPISAQIKIANTVIQLEVARTPEQQQMGLMYRRQLPDDRGMLFVFTSAHLISFWMKNTLIPLDMVFLRDGQVKSISHNVPPCTADPCPTYSSQLPVNQVLELRGGRATELGIKVGDRLTIEPVPTKPAVR